MKSCLKIVISYWLLVISTFIFSSSVSAAGEFESSQDVFYRVYENGITRVQHDIRLTNLTTNYYVSEYSLFLGFTDLENINAFDSGGKLETDITLQEDGTLVRLMLNDQVVGKGSILSFTISYETEEIASKNGRIWEIAIPKIKDSPELKAYNARLSIPSTFGRLSYIKPSSTVPVTDGLDFVFYKDDVLKGISVAFGDFQLFDFTLNYHLRNDRYYPIITEVALPPTTAYQEVLLDKLLPAPVTVYQDKDGNWLAKYRLDPSANIDITAIGKVKLFHEPQITDRLDDKMLEAYTKSQKYWEVLDPEIQEKVKTLKTAREIYDYVVETLSYDYARIDEKLPRAGAKAVLAKPNSAICMEFTDLFITLTRAAGIPAREVNGFAYAKNSRLRPLSLVKDVLHAWPQYYDREKGVWVAVDPTWGNTGGIDYFDVFDFNHFEFVIKGVDSEYPSPAGSYKEDLDQKDVEVTLAKDDSFEENVSLNLTLDLPNQMMAGFPKSGNVVLENKGNKIVAQRNIILTSDKLIPKEQVIAIDPLPPFGKVTAPFTLQSQTYFDNMDSKLNVTFGDKIYTQDIQVLPLYLVYLPWIGGGIGAGILFFVARKAWNLHVQKSRGQDSLRGKGKQSTPPRFKLPWEKRKD